MSSECFTLMQIKYPKSYSWDQAAIEICSSLLVVELIHQSLAKLTRDQLALSSQMAEVRRDEMRKTDSKPQPI